MTRKSTPEDFWKHVSGRDDPDNCWLWNGSLSVGYGRLKYKGRLVLAHRLSYMLSVGSIPPGLNILHSCDEPRCCNPKHLRPGTHADNAADRKVRHRHWRDRGMTALKGSANPMAKLTEAMVLEIWRLRSEKLTARAIAERLGVEIYNVSAVICGATWAHMKPTK